MELCVRVQPMLMSWRLRKTHWQAACGFLLSLALAVIHCGAQADFQGATHMVPLDEEGLGYGKAVATDAVARLPDNRRVRHGKAAFRPCRGAPGRPCSMR